MRLLFAKGSLGPAGGRVEDIGICFQLRCVAGWQARKEDCVRSVVNGHTIFGPVEPAIHLPCPPVCWWGIYQCPADEESRGCIGNGPRRVAGGCSGSFSCGVCELVARDSMMVGRPGRALRRWVPGS